MENHEYDYLFKIIFVGRTKWGKSSIINRFKFDEFSETHMSTIGVEFEVKFVEIDNKTIKLQIWDTAWQEGFKSIVS